MILNIIILFILRGDNNKMKSLPFFTNSWKQFQSQGLVNVMASSIVSDGLNMHNSAKTWLEQKTELHYMYLTCAYLHALGMGFKPSALT